ncbi:MAG TPA: UbiD family decarboxylase, partial [Xanthobacteraceae bacterium]
RTEVWRAMQGCASRFADCGKIVIAVSEDVDPGNTDAVLWSLAYRSNPSEDLHVQPYRSAGHGPKHGPKSGRRGADSTLLIDATMKHPMPPLALPAREFMERAVEIWRELGLGPLALRPPWHGYHLGEWSETWTDFARNAVAGEWTRNGENTFARRRRGITPETPVHMVEAPPKPGADE